MPTYQYRCPDCGHEFEEFQSMTEDPIETCPKCQGHTKRLITGGAGILFKGSGFYETDYRSSSYKKDAQKDKTDSASAAASSDSTKKTDASKS
ncbi:MAG: zinc ribbon domain-containing protein [bacterium]|nr:zinc ribbon domain-containing protein [bacterium]